MISVDKQEKDDADKLEVKSLDNQGMDDVENQGTESFDNQDTSDIDKVDGIEPDDDNEDTKCDFVFWSPKWLQSCRNKTFVLFSISWCTFAQSMLSVGFMKSVLTSLERRFGFTSMESGAIVSFNTVGALLSLFPVTCFRGVPRRLRCLAYCMCLVSIASFVFTVPHFGSGHYKYSGSKQPVCHRGGNVSYEGVCRFPETYVHAHPRLYRFIFWASSALIGIGTTPLYLHCILFIEANTDATESPLYIGALYSSTVLGPIAGYLMSAFFLQMLFVDVTSPHPGLTPADQSRWIGAWWIGFLISGVMCSLAAPALFAFPKELPGAARMRSASHRASAASEPISDALCLERGHFSRRLRLVMLNPTFVCLGLSGLATNLVISGMTAFGPKYLEVAFGFSPGEAAQVFGLMFVPVGAGGTVIGRILAHRLNASLLKMLQFQALLSLAFPPLVVLAFLAPCGSHMHGGRDRWAGITVPYNNDSSTPLSLNSACNNGCQCSENHLFLSPVCGDNGVTYFSPCYAGCDSVDANNTATCSCMKLNGSSLGKKPCEAQCRDAPLFVIPFAILVLLTFAIATPRLISTLRSVSGQQKSLVFGVHWLIVRFLGSVPGPVMMGAAFDGSCVFWRRTCQDRGSCYLYDFKLLKYMLMGICVASQVLMSFALLLAWYFHRSAQLKAQSGEVAISIKLPEQPIADNNNACNSNVAPDRDSAFHHSFGLFPFSLR